MVWLRKLWHIIRWPYDEYKLRKRIKELKKQDPYIYK